jgi:endonuclease YncB( thermonuclease family)
MENKISENYLKIDDIYKKLNESTKDNYDKFSFKGLITFVKVVYIIDGDTCDVVFPVNLGNNINFIKTRVRLLGYDAPEIKTKNSQQKELGLIAKKALSELVIDNNHIIMDIKGIDAFGRSLVVLYRKFRNI